MAARGVTAERRPLPCPSAVPFFCPIFFYHFPHLPPSTLKHMPPPLLTLCLLLLATLPCPAAPAPTPSPRAAAHWAFQPVRPVPAPATRDTTWPHNDLDRFILAKLEANHLTPSAPADRRTLIRRATYTLTGLPPRPEDVAAFLADTSPDAYANLVDRLLASPQYGERWARHWLDLARYSDTKGYVYAGEEKRFVHSHVYRDWVVNALNADLPYDRFILLQLAADQHQPTAQSSPAASALNAPTPLSSADLRTSSQRAIIAWW